MSKTQAAWRVNLEKVLKAVQTTIMKGSRKFIAVTAVDELLKARTTMEPYAEEAREKVRDVEGVKKLLDKLEGELVGALAEGALVPDDSPWNLSINEKAKRNVWTNDGIERLLGHIRTRLLTEVKNGAGVTGVVLTPAAERAIQDVLDTMTNYERAFEMAVQASWIGGTARELVITERPKTQAAPAAEGKAKLTFKGL